MLRRSPMKPIAKPMKRTGFVKSASRSVLFKDMPATLPATKNMKSKRKPAPAREVAHYRAVAALPCVRCGVAGYSQCAHSNRSVDGKGAGLKAHYLATFPLCCTRPGIVGCHVEHDQCIGADKQEMDRRTEQYIQDTHRKLGIAPC